MASDENWQFGLFLLQLLLVVVGVMVYVYVLCMHIYVHGPVYAHSVTRERC